MKVLYVVGLGRSGSTVLSNSLGQIEGFFSAGELNFVWGNSLVANRLCGCGRPFHDCPTWNAVMDAAFGGMDHVDAAGLMAVARSGTRSRHIPLLLSARGATTVRGRLQPLLQAYGQLYGAIGSVTGSRVIIDSSKQPAHGFAMGMVPGVDLRVLHLVRDPRAVAYSWLKKKAQPDSTSKQFMYRRSPVKSALTWNAWNASAEEFWRRSPERYLRLRYEDFVVDPRRSFTEITSFVGEPDVELPLAGDREVRLGISHTVSGNPNRFDTGAVKLRQDDEWRHKMRPRDRKVVTALTVPLLKHYSYPVDDSRRKDPVAPPRP